MAASLVTGAGIVISGMFATSVGIIVKSISIINTRKFLIENNYYHNNTKLANLKKRQKELAEREKILQNDLNQIEIEINSAYQEKNKIIKTEQMMRQCMKKGFLLYDLLFSLRTTNTEELKGLLISHSRGHDI